MYNTFLSELERQFLPEKIKDGQVSRAALLESCRNGGGVELLPLFLVWSNDGCCDGQ